MRYGKYLFGVVVFAAGCAGQGEPAVSSAQGEVGVFLGNAPDGVNCISFTFANEDGNTQSFQFATTVSNVRVINNLTVGAYDLSAVAYSAGIAPPVSNADCQAVPASSPWTTETPVPLVVQEGLRTNVTLQLEPTGRAGVTVTWFEPPVVVAQGQGNVQAMVANTTASGPFVVWEVAAGGGASGQMTALFDSPGNAPFLLIPGLSNPAEVAIDPDSGTVFVENFVTNTTDANGNIIADGSIANNAGTLVAGINPGDLGFAVADHTAYWVNMPAGAGVAAAQPFSIDCFPCASSLAVGQIGANGLTAHGDRVYWGTNDGSLEGMAVTDAAPTTLTSIAPRQAYGATADDQFAYFIDVAPGVSISASKIDRVPSTGGPAVTLVDGIPGGAFPIQQFHGFIYFLSFGAGIERVPTGGGPVEPLVVGSIGGFALATDTGGHDVLYWSDDTHGGLIWRARL